MYRLLIIDDPQSCEAVKNLLDWSAYGFSVVMTADSYVEGVNLALDLHPHVTLLGTGLGKFRGHEMADNLRSMGLRSVYAIMSDERDPEQIVQAMRAGVRDYLHKPVEEQELRDFAERVVVHELGGSLPRADQEIGRAHV